MKWTLRRCAAAIAMFLAASSHAYAAPTAQQQKIAAAQYLIGTWNCAHTVGTFSGNYTTTFANVVGNLWLKQTYNFPANQMGDNQPAATGEFLMGYDERRQIWVRFGALSTGQWFAIRMTETGDGGWSWKYISFSKNRAPETPGSDATFSKKSDSEYVVDGPTYKQGVTEVTEHHSCRKS